MNRKNHVFILPQLLASIHRRELTSFLENAQLLGYQDESALRLMRYLQGTEVGA